MKPRRLALLLASAAFFSAAFPPWGLGLLAWIALVPLILALEGLPPRAAATDAWLTGFTAWLIITFWIWRTFDAAGVARPVALSSWMLLSAVMALYFAAFGAACAVPVSSYARPFFLGAVWVILEALRGVLLTGYPWCTLAMSQAMSPDLLALLPLSGAAGLSFLIVAFNAALAGIRRGGVVPALVVGFTVAMLLMLTGITSTDEPPARTVRVGLLQGNIDQYRKWDDRFVKEIRASYARLALQAARDGAEVIIWPESALPGWVPNDADETAALASAVSTTRRPNMVGAVTSRFGKDYNTVFLVGPDGRIIEPYHKQRLVPFGEFIPFGGFLRRWVPYLGKLGIFSAGPGPVLFDAAGLKWAPNICYEALFASIPRDAVAMGADVLVNVTNDGWFLDTAAPEQHLWANVLRAAETGRPLVRAANTGVSAAIDAHGRVLFRSPMLTQGAWVVDVPVPPTGTTFYVRWGDWWLYVCCIFVLIQISQLIRRSRG